MSNFHSLLSDYGILTKRSPLRRFDIRWEPEQRAGNVMADVLIEYFNSVFTKKIHYKCVIACTGHQWITIYERE